MITFTTITLLFLAALGYVKGAAQYCYSCSSDSVLCRQTVYDGKYLAAQLCKSKCFVRTEEFGYKKEKKVFRGCFDGWLGGLVKYSYKGCRVQKYLGRQVEWCFCSGDFCNGASREELNSVSGGSIPSKVKYHYNPPSYIDVKKLHSEKAKAPSGESYETYDYDAKTNTVDEISRTSIKPEDNKIGESSYTVVPHKVCRGKLDGAFYDPDDCAGFYFCSNGIPYRMKCSAGTVWHEDLKSCTFPERLEKPCYPYNYDVQYPAEPKHRANEDIIPPEIQKEKSKKTTLQDRFTKTKTSIRYTQNVHKFTGAPNKSH